VLAASEPDEMDRAVKLGTVFEEEVEEPKLDSSLVGGSSLSCPGSNSRPRSGRQG
jgi:hypothetical protein